MSSKPFDKALHLELKTSLTFSLLLLALYITAILSVIIVAVVTELMFFLLLPILIYSAYYYFKKHILLSANSSVVGMSQSIDGDWTLQRYDQSKLAVELCDDSYMHPLLVILNFKAINNNRGISLTLFRDSLGVEQHRQLRCRLRLSKPVDKERLLRR